MAPLVRTGGSRHTGLAALPHRNIHLRKRMRRDIVKLFKAYMLLMIFLLSLLPEPFILKHLGVTLRADTLVLWMAGIEAVDAWDEYKREKNRNKSNHDSGVKKNGKSKKETRV